MSDRTLKLQVLFGAVDRLLAPMRGMLGGSKALSKALHETQTQIAGLKRAQVAIGQYRGAEQRLQSSSAALEEAKAKTAALRAEIEKVDAPTKKMARELAAAEKAEAAASKRHAEHSERLRELSGKLGAAGVDVADLSRDERRLADSVAEANKRLEQQRASLERVQRAQRQGQNLQRIGGKIAGAGAAASLMMAPVAAGGMAAAQQAREFQSGMTDLALKANLGAAETRQIADNLLRIGPLVAQLPEDLRQGLDTLAGFGLSVKDGQAMITPIAKTATAYKATIEDLSKATFAGVDNLKVPIGQTGRMLDIMAAAGKAGAFEIKDMAGHFPALTAAAQALGQTGAPAVADLAAALQIARKGAGSSDEAANNVMNLLNKINSPDAINNFKKFGVDLPKALQQAYAKGKTPLEAIAELTQQATKGDLSKLPFLFGDAQVQAALRPLIQNIGLYRQIRSDALGATGVVEGDFNRRMQDDAARNEQAMARIQAAAIKVGNVLLPIFGRIADFVGRAADAFSNLDPTAQTAIVVIGMIATVLGPLLIVIGAVVSAVGAIGAALGVAFLPAIGIIAAVVAVVALLAGAAYLIYQNWGKITAFFTGIWNDIKTAFDGGLMGVLALLFKWQTDLILALWDAVSGAVGWLISNFPAIWAGFKTVMWNVLWNGLLLLPRLFFQFGVNTLTGFMDGIRSIGASLWKLVTGLADRVKNTFKSVLGINSPSRVFAQLGGFMMEGLEQGLDRGAESPIARLKTAGDAMRKVMAGSILMTAQPAIAATSIGGPGHAPASASASAAPVTIGELHVHPSPGMDEKALADLVIKKILELRRQDDAAKRSSFKDDD